MALTAKEILKTMPDNTERDMAISHLLQATDMVLNSWIKHHNPTLDLTADKLEGPGSEAEAENKEMDGDISLGMMTLHSDGFVDILYQRVDGSYYRKSEYWGINFFDTPVKTKRFDKDANNASARDKDGAPTEPSLDNSA